ncbi:MAG: gamma carbonic anhydrase family protein [Gemmatimonadales bacterium]|nr:MAG: gamma carbonic anhydrase family protein [Gemmatimonadales bacterium]
MALLIPFRGRTPQIAPDAFVAPNAVLIGDVRVEAKASIWFGAVLRGDDPDHPIVVGAGANVQDGAIVHVGTWGPTLIGPSVTVGHGAIFESCQIGEGTVVGMNATILQEAVVGRECLLAAGTVVLEGAEIPDRSVVAGVPGRVRKTLEGSAAGWVRRSGKHYVELSRAYLEEGVHTLDPAGTLDASGTSPDHTPGDS